MTSERVHPASLPAAQMSHGTGLRFWWPVVAIAIVFLAFAAFAGLSWRLQAGAYALGAEAMREFPGDEVDALVALARSENRALAERNRAVHALGQIGDPRALPALERLYTGRECQHDRLICQHEVRKAIERCRGRNWAPRWLPLLPHAPR